MDRTVVAREKIVYDHLMALVVALPLRPNSPTAPNDESSSTRDLALNIADLISAELITMDPQLDCFN